MIQLESDNEDSDLDYYEMQEDNEKSLLVRHSPRMGLAQYEGTGSVSKDSVDTTHNDETKKAPWFIYLLSFFAAIGGFLFGYDTGVVSGAMLLLKNKFKLSSILEEVIVSVTIGFACLFALCGGFLNDRFGRKFTTILASFVFTIGAGILAAAVNVAMLIVGRAILGIGIGLASMTVPIYIAECAPPHLRGRLVTLNNLFITGGQFIASTIDGAFSYDKENGWRFMLGLAAVPSIIQFFGFLFLPESPRWLVAHGKVEDAEIVLVNIRGHNNVKEELEEVKLSVEEDRREKELSGGSNVFMKILRTPSVRRALFVGCGLQFFQQLSGINTVMYYSATIIKMSGVREESTAIWLAAGTAFINFIFTIVALFLVERLGRRKLIIGSLAGVLLSLVVLAVGFQLAAFNSPPVTINEDVDVMCNPYSWCENCIENTKCGYCYNDFGNGAVNGSCLPIEGDDSTHSMAGRCNSTEEVDHLVFAYGYCPTKFAWMGIAGLGLYLMFFAPGMGPMPWTINSEIYPLWARSTGNSLSTATNWLCNIVVSMTFLTLTETITKYGTYWLFVGIVIVGLVFMLLTVPETQGKKLEEVEELFSRPLCSCGGGSDSVNSKYSS